MDDDDDVIEYWTAHRRPAWQVVVVALVGAAGVLAVHFGPVRAGIEAQLTSDARQALSAAGLAGATVSFSGRDARLSGDPALLPAAVEVVGGVRGVRLARDDSPDVPVAATIEETATATATEVETVTVPADLAAQLAALPPITFDQESAVLSADAVAVVTAAAGLLNAPDAGGRFLVAAHTDSVGSVEQNMAVSKLRADAVVEALIGEGVAPDRLDAAGYGELRPAVAPEAGAADREANRRVEILPLP